MRPSTAVGSRVSVLLVDDNSERGRHRDDHCYRLRSRRSLPPNAACPLRAVDGVALATRRHARLHLVIRARSSLVTTGVRRSLIARPTGRARELDRARHCDIGPECSLSPRCSPHARHLARQMTPVRIPGDCRRSDPYIKVHDFEDLEATRAPAASPDILPRSGSDGSVDHSFLAFLSSE